jgi:hypothetical protein
MYIIAFNGPPYSGKDTLAQFVLEHIESQIRVPPPMKMESLSLPLRSIAYAMVGRTYVATRDDDWNGYPKFKETLFPSLGRTGRQLMIDASESFLKEVYGQEIMANLLITRNQGCAENSLLLIRDSGFQCEIDPLLYWAGERNLFLVRVSRAGCDFNNDSREWVHHRHSFMTMDIDNNGSLDDLRTEAGRLYGRLVNQKGWKL